MAAELEKALKQAPDDWKLRRVYADWLEEQGRGEEAEEQRRVAVEWELREDGRRPRADKAEYRTTDDSAAWRKLHKIRHAGCYICPWHDGENRGRRPHRSWKKRRKQRWRAR
jgi:uncharacterized protein (TIGR02996 family)